MRFGPFLLAFGMTTVPYLLLLALAATAWPATHAYSPVFVDTTSVVAADTARFPAMYATKLPTPTPEQWEKDYGRYERFVTPEIKKTQQGLSFVKDGVQTWWVANSARPHAQLDTATRITDAARLPGNWRSIANRVVVHIDSFSIADQKFYRKATVHELPGVVTLGVTDQKFSLLTDEPKAKRLTRNYSLLQQRYLLLYGASKAAGAVAQVGLDTEDRLLLHNCSVTERKIPGRYLTYQTVIRQSIFTRQ